MDCLDVLKFCSKICENLVHPDPVLPVTPIMLKLFLSSYNEFSFICVLFNSDVVEGC